MDRPPRILALASYPSSVASTRFRLTQMVDYLWAHGIEVHFEPFLDEDFLRGFYRPGNRLWKATRLGRRSLARLASSLAASGYDAVFIQREAALVGPPYAEFILRTLKGLPIIFDFDDAIWDLNPAQSVHPVAARFLRSPGKCWYTMSRADCVMAGSSFLGKRAAEVAARVEIVPTVVSTENWVPLPCRLRGELYAEDVPRIGWVGSHTTASQLSLVEPALRRLRAEGHQFELHVVGAPPDFSLEGVKLHARPWALQTEIEEFQRIDIGLAPMFEEPVYQGKCGFKQIQYMAVGVPFISSWVGGARDFVEDGEVGLVARTKEDWYAHLRALLGSQQLRARLSRSGLARVKEHYSAEVQGPRVARIVEDVLARRWV